MSKRGRPKKPTVLKLLEGNRGKRKLDPEAEPRPDDSMPDAPPFLNKIAKQEWFRLAPELNKLGLLTKVDPTAFAAYCSLYSTFVSCELKIGKPMFRHIIRNNGQLIPNPVITLRTRTLTQMKSYLGLFGLSPSDRTGLAAKPLVQKKDDDDLDAFISKKA